ncbi:hypothetical protein PGB90_000534 [Kerria lacca]
MMSQTNAFFVIRQLLSELRKITPTQKLKHSIIVPHILNQCRKYKVTDAQLCKKRGEMIFLVNTYRCYLESTRRYKELLEKYHSKGERSIEQTADMVGFKLPHDPK